MKVLKGNRIIIIQDEEYPRFKANGYCEISEDGKQAPNDTEVSDDTEVPTKNKKGK